MLVDLIRKPSIGRLLTMFMLLVSLISLAHPVMSKGCNSTFKYTTPDTTLYHRFAVSDPDDIYNILVWKIDPVTGEYIKVDPESNVYVWIPDPEDPTEGEVRISKALIRDWEVVVDIIDDDIPKATDAWKIDKGDPASYKKIYPTVGGVLVSVDKLGLLAPYIGVASTILVATAATAIYVRRVKRRKEKR
jgi:hypothetical protein